MFRDSFERRKPPQNWKHREIGFPFANSIKLDEALQCTDSDLSIYLSKRSLTTELQNLKSQSSLKKIEVSPMVVN